MQVENSQRKLSFDIPLNKHPDDNFKFQSKNDQIFLWISQWNDKQICDGISELMKSCSYHSKVTLSTVLEPLVHGDFIYHKFDANCSGSFAYPSTFITREVKGRLYKDVNKTRKRQKATVCQIRSTHITSQDDIQRWSANSILPNVKTKTNAKAAEEVSTTSLPEINKPFKSCLSIDLYPGFTLNKSSKINHAFPEITINESKTISGARSNKAFLFQSPSHSTFSERRSRPQQMLHQKSKSAPHINFFRSNITNVDHKEASQVVEDQVFKSLSAGLQIERRHLQKISPKDLSPRVNKSHSDGFLPKLEDVQVSLKSYKSYDEQLSCLFSWFSTWTEWQKELFLGNLLKLLNSPQLYFLYASIMISLYRDFISLLPQKISFKILSYLHPKNLKQCAKVCEKWKLFCEHDTIWKPICVRKNISRAIEVSKYIEKFYAYKVVKNNWLDGKFKIKDLSSPSGSGRRPDLATEGLN
ncbi:uncharacterized protein [Clytia hemisphaerica]|uniref:F-box domain-containing protein n=1 Tax=Clytia hemisphaerica TaxID=252671 RepID=A0A7M5V137_9CNID